MPSGVGQVALGIQISIQFFVPLVGRGALTHAARPSRAVSGRGHDLQVLGSFTQQSRGGRSASLASRCRPRLCSGFLKPAGNNYDGYTRTPRRIPAYPRRPGRRHSTFGGVRTDSAAAEVVHLEVAPRAAGLRASSRYIDSVEPITQEFQRRRRLTPHARAHGRQNTCVYTHLCTAVYLGTRMLVCTHM